MRKTFVLISEAASPSVLIEQCGLLPCGIIEPCIVFSFGAAAGAPDPLACSPTVCDPAAAGANGELGFDPAEAAAGGELGFDPAEAGANGELLLELTGICTAPSVMTFGAGRRRAPERLEGRVAWLSLPRPLDDPANAAMARLALP